jgi:hypothetical protein
MRVHEEKIIDHWANRDDQGMAMQAGWVPPSLPYLIRMARALRQARHSTNPGLSRRCGSDGVP